MEKCAKTANDKILEQSYNDNISLKKKYSP